MPAQKRARALAIAAMYGALHSASLMDSYGIVDYCMIVNEEVRLPFVSRDRGTAPDTKPCRFPTATVQRCSQLGAAGPPFRE